MTHTTGQVNALIQEIESLESEKADLLEALKDMAYSQVAANFRDAYEMRIAQSIAEETAEAAISKATP